MKIHKTFGLDLGTTNSTASVIVDGKLIFVEDFKNKSIPSIVAVNKEKIEVGVKARNTYNRDSSLGIRSIKREIGKEKKFPLGDKEYLPEEISSLIIKHCAELLNQQINKNEDVVYDRVVITVPAYFNVAQKDATRKAGEMAGLDVVMLLEEPTAAAINFATQNNVENGLFMVYDLGGGTFDVSIVEKIGNVPVVLATAGNNYLGGDNFDNILAHYFVDYLKENGFDINDNTSKEEIGIKFRHVMLQAEIVKKELSIKESVNITNYDIFGDGTGVELIIENFTREKFEELIKEKIEQDTIYEIDKTLSKLYEMHKKTIDDITHIVLVGGSTKIPYVQKVIKEKYCSNKENLEIYLYDPDYCVSAGAGLIAASYPMVLEDGEIEILVNAPYEIDGVTYIFGELTKGNIDSIEFIADEICSKVDVDDNNQFTASISKCGISNIKYRLYCNNEIRSEFSELSLNSSEIIAPTAMQNETINIEIVDLETHSIEKFPLIKANQPLPCEATYNFKINEYSSEEIILPVWEGPRNPFDLVIQVPKDTLIGSRITVNIKVDVLANITLNVEMNGKKLDGEYVYHANVSMDEEKFEEYNNLFEERISNVKDLREKEDMYKQKQILDREIEEAKNNNDDNHYNASIEKYQNLVNQMPKEAIYTDEDFEKLGEEIKTKITKDSNVTVEDVDNAVFFGKRALSRGDETQAEECYSQLQSYLTSVNLTSDPKLLFSLSVKWAVDIIDMGKKIIECNRNESVIAMVNKEIENVTTRLENIISEFSNDPDLSTVTVEDSTKILASFGKLLELCEQYGPRDVEYTEKISEFRGRVSKA